MCVLGNRFDQPSLVQLRYRNPGWRQQQGNKSSASARHSALVSPQNQLRNYSWCQMPHFQKPDGAGISPPFCRAPPAAHQLPGTVQCLGCCQTQSPSWPCKAAFPPVLCHDSCTPLSTAFRRCQQAGGQDPQLPVWVPSLLCPPLWNVLPGEVRKGPPVLAQEGISTQAIGPLGTK